MNTFHGFAQTQREDINLEKLKRIYSKYKKISESNRKRKIKKESALIIVDLWNEGINDDNHYSTLRDTLLRALDKIRFPVVYANHIGGPNNDLEGEPKGLDEAIYYACRHTPVHFFNGDGFYEINNRFVSADPDQVNNHLIKYKVEDIYFCGNSLPGCIFNAYVSMQYFLEKSYNCYAVIDLCSAPPFITHKSAIREEIYAQYRFCEAMGIDIVYSDELY